MDQAAIDDSTPVRPTRPSLQNLWSEWLRLEGQYGDTNEECTCLGRLQSEIEIEICGRPAETVNDLLIKIALMRNFVECCSPTIDERELALLASVEAGIRAMAAATDGGSGHHEG